MKTNIKLVPIVNIITLGTVTSLTMGAAYKEWEYSWRPRN